MKKNEGREADKLATVINITHKKKSAILRVRTRDGAFPVWNTALYYPCSGSLYQSAD